MVVPLCVGHPVFCLVNGSTCLFTNRGFGVQHMWVLPQVGLQGNGPIKYVGIHFSIIVGTYSRDLCLVLSFHVDFHDCEFSIWMYSPSNTDSIPENHMSLSCLVAEICRFKVFYFWPSKSSRIDTIHRKIVSSVNRIDFQCGSHLHSLSQWQDAIYLHLLPFCRIWEKVELFALDQRDLTTDE